MLDMLYLMDRAKPSTLEPKTMYSHEMVKEIIALIESRRDLASRRLGFEASKYPHQAGGLEAALTAALRIMTEEQRQKFFQDEIDTHNWILANDA